MIFFTSDLHFGHKNILNLCSDTRKANSVEEHDEILINNWNSKVSNTDEIYILGDMFFCNVERAKEILERLNGKKHYVLGNHERPFKNGLIDSYFESISNYKEIWIGDIFVTMMHYPIKEWNRMHYGSFHFYGHVHGKFKNVDRSFDVGIDSRTDMSVWSWDELYGILIKKEIKNHHE